ncbi:dienelactone hydrolase family protein [Anthocerotibacter panamensis]|uniref:dienelactone hydrolase family protein n=1 Tax=Anthocerotibacter panamensis TaxID=2857077 RepID=UPI001C401FDE|nr:dienelactone hydrolase family protein [Anthocerotibacter panamensis]
MDLQHWNHTRLSTLSRRTFLGGLAIAGWALYAGPSGSEEEISQEQVSFARQGGLITGFQARPALSDGAGVLIVHDVWGLNAYIKGIALALARAGYVALVPDLYSRLGGTPALPLRSVQEARNTIQQLGDGQVVSDLDASFIYLEQQVKSVDIRPRIAVLGLGWGGQKALLYATENEDLKGAIDFYGPSPEPVERLRQTEAPLLGNFADPKEDAASNLSATQTFLSGAQKSFDFKIFPGTQPDFHNPASPNYDRAAAQDAWERTLVFLSKVLHPPVSEVKPLAEPPSTPTTPIAPPQPPTKVSPSKNPSKPPKSARSPAHPQRD